MFHQVSGWYLVLAQGNSPSAGHPLQTEDANNILTEDSQTLLTEN